jgi:hypothetical protein
MERFANRRERELAKIPTDTSDLKTKCITVMVLEEEGKTILQPLITGQDTQSVQELFKKNTLEVWLPNGQSDIAQFDVAILKYKQVMQPPKVCSRIEVRLLEEPL